MASLKKQQYYFFFFCTLYMLTGIGALVLAQTWLSQSADGAPRDAVISRAIEEAGMYLGGIVAGTALVGFVGGASPVKHKMFLLTFVMLMIMVIIAELGLGGVIWFKTLRMRSLFQDQWLTWGDGLKIAFQDMKSQAGYDQCCGYKYNNDVVFSGACSATQSVNYPGCEEKVSAFADRYLRKLFTSLFGFTIVNAICFVSTVILIQTRNDEERYIRIGKKEGRTYQNVI